MANIFSRFQNWLRKKRSFRVSWFSTDEEETPEPEESLEELPPHLTGRLVELTQKLSIPPRDEEAVQEALKSALKKWLDNPNLAENSLVVLSSPVAAGSRILTESIEPWALEQHIPIRLLQWGSRPIEPTKIKDKLQSQIGGGTTSGEKGIAIIPNLTWCFPRSAEGLDGIEYLRDVLLQNRSQFWAIGSGQVGWEYLNSVCQINSYCSQNLILSKLDGENLQKWLKPIVTEMGITFSQSFIEANLPNSSDKSPEEQYFEKLADVSDGVSTVAVQVFLKSIRYKPDGEDNKQEGQLKAVTPKLPPLPELEPDDNYLLYSLLLHGDLTLEALAESLGDEPQIVQHRLEVLRRAGIVKQQDRVAKVNPIHYPKLKGRLAGNNFVID